VHEIDSLSLFVGTGVCNARCAHCAGVPFRKDAPKEDGQVDVALVTQTMRDCYRKGARSLSISSSGEPTLSPVSVTKVLSLAQVLRGENIFFPRINLYTNGIRIGTDLNFCKRFLPSWLKSGLTHIYLTIHDVDVEKNALVYGVPVYPPLDRIIPRIKCGGFSLRVNYILKDSTAEEFQNTMEYLHFVLGADSIAVWPLRDADDKIDSQTLPSLEELRKMAEWVEAHPCYRVRFLASEFLHKEFYNRKLTLFPDGTLTNTWCR
jgi:molybdenum cofactor biosynthesis enzyme MoaA